jgi:hypothetical protein
MSEKALRVGVDAVYFKNLCTPSLALSLEQRRQDALQPDGVREEISWIGCRCMNGNASGRDGQVQAGAWCNIAGSRGFLSAESNSLTALQNQILQHQQTMELQMKQFELIKL